MGPQAQLIYEGIMAGMTLYRTLSVEQREPTHEELLALSQRNQDLLAQLQAGVTARPG